MDKDKIKWQSRKIEAQSRAVSRKIGIAHDFRPDELIYNQASGMIVASVERRSLDEYDRRLFMRHVSKRRYRQLGSPPPYVHYANVISSSTKPIVYYTVTQVTRSKQPFVSYNATKDRLTERLGGFGGDWMSVDRFDFDRRSAGTVLTREGLMLPKPYKSGWISKLLGVTPDDSSLICSCGLQGPEKGRTKMRRVDYWLCSIELGTQKITLLSRLEKIWF